MRLLQYKSNEMFSSTELIRKSKMIFNKIIDGSVEKAIILRDGKPSFLLMEFAKYESIMSEFEELKEYVDSIKENLGQEEYKPKEKKNEFIKENETIFEEPALEIINSDIKDEKAAKKAAKKEKKKNKKLKEKQVTEKKVEFTIESTPQTEKNITNKFSKEELKQAVKFKSVTPPRPEPVKKEIPPVIEEEIVAPLTEIIINDEDEIEEVKIETKKEEPTVIEEVEEISEEEEIQSALDTIKSIDFDDGMRKMAEDKIKEKILQTRALREIKAEEEKQLIDQEEEEELVIVNQVEEKKEQKQRELSEFWD